VRIEMPSALADPLPTTPPRRPGSARLTSHIDIEQEAGGSLLLRGGSRVLVTSRDSSEVVTAATARARLGADRALETLEVSPPEIEVAPLLGRIVGRGFRAAVDAVYGDEKRSAGALHLLLDDLPTAALISGYAALYSGEMQVQPKHLERGVLRADICSGWRSDGTMLVSLRENGTLPVPLGTSATRLAASDDPLAWHEMSPLASGAMRRQRLIEVTGDAVEVLAMFRDTHLDMKGAERVLHEYSLAATVDASTQALRHIEATPRVLPWPECPAAASSASRLNGLALSELPRFVAEEMRGTSTCTHLNDLLRSLSEVKGLLAHLSSPI
jgi:Protein of unknown function (DUF2889)